jgi:iron complex outermembrane receptor protein
VKNLIDNLPEQAIFGDPTKYASRFVRCSQATPDQRAQADACLNFPNFDPIAFIDSPTENLGELKTRGIDVSAGWRSGATGYGNFALTFDGTYVDQFKFQREKGGEFINAVGRYSDSAPVFRWQHVAAVNWSMGSWAATLAQRYKSGYTDQDPSLNPKVDSYLVHDLSVSWTGIKNLTLTAGVLNIFDEDPPVTVQVTTFQRGYDPRFTDPLGRTFLLRAQYKFF